ncbi:CoA-binding protein [Alkalispirochaeta odontotermitis]|nr:CoA-binding protein [Alkalispirochaeta odontotermitis]CAB1084271.1 Acetyl-CoA synthetase (ADP-forming) alpha and beta chains, putative [Olavius algarvensis Delta 1 endosymbiont]
MDFFFKPRGVAVIGASANPVKGGYFILNNLLKGYNGGIYPVNPAYSEIDGLSCFSAVLDVPDPVDLAIIFVPAPRVPRVLRECAERGIKGAMIESGGFAESGSQGEKLQEQILAISRKTGIRIWGPNCMGLVDAVHDCVFSFVLPAIWEKGLTTGNVSLVVQSGMLSAGFLIDIMSNGIMGISKACSIGNKVDVNECDILEYLIDDPDTGTIGLYLESIPDGRRFMELCRTSRKPIVVLRGGKSKKGAEAAMSHTASLAGNGAVISSALAQVGVIEAFDFKQMMDLCRTLADYPEIQAKDGRRVAILTMSGAAGIVSADFIEQQGLSVAELDGSTVDRLKQIFPAWMPASNPVDLWPAVERHGRKKAYQCAFEAVFDDPNVDAVLFHSFVGGAASWIDMSDPVEMARQSDKPLFGWLMGNRNEAHRFQMNARELGLPIFSELYRTVECMAAVLTRERPPDCGHKRMQLTESVSIGDRLNSLAANDGGILDEFQAKQILSLCEIPVVSEKLVASASEACQTAGEIGFPVVVKGLLPGEIHKTELGLVRTGIATAEEVGQTFNEFQNNMAEVGTILIQKQVLGEPELIAGLIRDPQFGPCVMCGFGGILAEVMADSVFAAAPLNKSEALALIDRLKTQKLLNGFRGSAPLNREKLADILVRLGDLGASFERIKEIDINPLIVSEGIPVAVDASIILVD